MDNSSHLDVRQGSPSATATSRRANHRALLAVLALLVAACAIPPELHQSRLAMHLGYRGMQADAYRKLDGQIMARIDGDVRPEGWPVWLTGGLGWGGANHEEDDQTCFFFVCNEPTTLKSTTVEFNLGARRWAALDGLLPHFFVGAGGALVRGDADLYLGQRRKVGDNAVALGGFAECGLEIPTENGGVGLQLRVFRGESTTMFGAPANNDFDELTVFYAFRW